MQDIKYKIYIAGLLHDIGKLVYRSLPNSHGGHEELGEQFIREYLSKVSFLSREDVEDIVHFSKHHSIFSYVRLADHIVSAERDNEDNKSTRRPLISVLSSLAQTKENINVWYHEPQVVQLENVFAVNKNTLLSNWQLKAEDIENVIQSHGKVLKGLKNDFLYLEKLKSYKELSQTLYYLLEKYTAKVSSAGYMSLPDVSLFDHNRAIAGIVNCITYDLDETTLREYKPDNNVEKFLLVKGDISGIQKFIYSNIKLERAGSGKKLAKKLRGRSFYVSLLTDFLAEQLIEKLGLAQANIIFSGGGHFIAVLPNNQSIIDEIANFEKEINLFLIDKIGLHLSLNFAYTECNKDLYSNSSKYFKALSENLEEKKHKKFGHYLQETFDAIRFKVPKHEATEFTDDEDLGKRIPYANYLIQVKVEGNLTEDFEKATVSRLFIFNTHFLMLDNFREEERLYKILKENEKSIKSIKVIKLNDTDFLDIANKFDFLNVPISYSFKFVGKEAPTDSKDRELLSFEDLAKLDYKNGELSCPQLAVMRLDVDNLGTLFAFGLGDKSTFSRVATLSRELHHFFSGYFNVLAKKYQLYITYSGGDDAFIIGSWHNVMHFAKELYLEFKKFACDNERVHFSAGVFMCDPHYPVAKFAEDAANAEHLSKLFDGEKKNAITVFDHTLSWADYCAMLDFSETLLSYTKGDDEKDSGKLARSLVHRLLRLIKSCMSKNGTIDTQKMYQNLAQLHYLFARHGFDEQRISNAQSGIENAIIKVILQNFSKENLIKNFSIPTHYVVLKTRELSKK